jgi:hypothetical protein
MKTSAQSSSFKTYTFIALCAVVGAASFWAGRMSVASSQTTAAAKAPSGSSAARRDTGSASTTTFPGQGATLADLLHAKGKPDADALAAWAKNLTPEEIADALKSLQGLPAGLQRNALLSAVVNAWAERDPQGFLASSGNVTVPRMREGGVDDALRVWASQDPKAALDWMKQNPGSAPPVALQQRYAAAIAGYAATDPLGALTTVNALAENSGADLALKNSALQALTNSLADQGNFTDALTMFAQMPAGQMQTNAYNTMVQRWADSNPEDASAWVAALTDPAQRNQLGTRVAQTWAASDPASAAAWAAQMDQQSGASGLANSQLLASAISSWSAYDLDAPATFLNQMQAGPGKDNAVAIFATRAGQEDPSSALQWVSTISDDQLRGRAATAVAFQMLQTDPNGFNQFISNTTLMSDQQKQMLQSIPPGMVNGIGMAMAGGGGGGFGGGGGQGGGGGGGFQNRIDGMILNGGGFFNQGQGGPGGGGQGGQGGGFQGGGRRGGGGFGGGGFGGGGGGGGGG